VTRIRMAAHVHSSWSYDASWGLDRLAGAFARRGYRAVLMAEHSQTFSEQKWQEYQHACAETSRPGLLVVPGIEYADRDDVLHLPVWGPVPFLGKFPAPGAVAEVASQMGGVTVLAHPWRRDAWRRVDSEWLELLSGLEVWNRKYDGWAPRPAACELADTSGLQPFVTLDFHNRRQFFPMAMVTDLPSDGVTMPAIHEALQKGCCRPEVFRIPVNKFTDGPLGAVTRAAEKARKAGAGVVRWVTG
jgi:hypothetical protein